MKLKIRTIMSLTKATYSAVEQHARDKGIRYSEAYARGYCAHPETKMPELMSIGERCAWLGGFYDGHNQTSYEESRALSV